MNFHEKYCVHHTKNFLNKIKLHIYFLTHGSPWKKDITICMILKKTFYHKCVSFHVIPWDILCVLEEEKRISDVFFLIEFGEKYFVHEITIKKNN
jgi:hypothetical protein